MVNIVIGFLALIGLVQMVSASFFALRSCLLVDSDLGDEGISSSSVSALCLPLYIGVNGVAGSDSFATTNTSSCSGFCLGLLWIQVSCSDTLGQGSPRYGFPDLGS